MTGQLTESLGLLDTLMQHARLADIVRHEKVIIPPPPSCPT